MSGHSLKHLSATFGLYLLINAFIQSNTIN
jgi:hypothetical protein